MAQRRIDPAAVAAILAVLCAALALPVLGGPIASLWTTPDPADFDVSRLVLLHSTLPRLCIAALSGAALAASGAILQQALANPLASPTTIGLDAGARLALSLATLFTPVLAGFGRDMVALAGSAAAVGLVFALTRQQRFAPVPLVLSGLLVSLYCGVLSALLVLVESRYLVGLFIWGGGSLSQQSWQPTLLLALRMACVAPLALILVRPLRLLDLGEDAARGLGLKVARLRVLALAVALALSSFVASIVGIIGFVGLVAPLMARACGANDFGARLIWSMVLGALLLLLTDLGLQAVAGEAADLLPTGAMTAILGSPILLVLLARLPAMARRPLGLASLPAARPGLAPPVAGWSMLLGGLLMLLVVAALLGRVPTGEWAFLPRDEWSEILPWRLPRALAAGSAGALLAVAGLVLQRLTGNEMASPQILGIGSGAALGVGVGLFLLPAIGGVAAVLCAFGGSLAVLLLILVFARRTGFAPERVLLAGIAVGALLDAVLGVASAIGDPRAIRLLGWIAGATSGTQGMEAVSAVVQAVIGTALACLAWRFLALLPLGPSQAGALGLDVPRARLVLVVLAAFATALATPVVGPLTFVGLIAPHLVRLCGVRGVHSAILASALSGAAILVTADWLARQIVYPFQLPTGLVAALVGAPVLFFLLQKRDRAA